MASSYDRAITVFSPDGHLFQVEYAQEAVRKGAICVGVCGKSIIVLAVERKAVAELQNPKTVRKIYKLDDHISMAFAGLTADARIITSLARIECQNYRLSFEDPVTLEYITRFIAEKKQVYTQSNGRRPFGISCLIAGFDYGKTPHLYTTDPSGVYFEWKANAVGRNSKSALDILESKFNDEIAENDSKVIKLALQALLEVIPADPKVIELVTIKNDQPFNVVDSETVAKYLAEIEKEGETKKKK